MIVFLVSQINLIPSFSQEKKRKVQKCTYVLGWNPRKLADYRTWAA